METILCYDTLKGINVLVEVQDEVATYLKRSYWREEMQQRRYYKRVLSLEETWIPSMASTEEIVLNEEQKVIFRRAVGRLNTYEYELFILRFELEMSLGEIADYLGISISYASKKVRCLRQKLIELLKMENEYL